MDWREIYKKKKNGGSVQSSAPATGTTSSVASSGSDWKSIYQSKMRSIASGETAAPDTRGVKIDTVASSASSTSSKKKKKEEDYTPSIRKYNEDVETIRKYNKEYGAKNTFLGETGRSIVDSLNGKKAQAEEKKNKAVESLKEQGLSDKQIRGAAAKKYTQDAIRRKVGVESNADLLTDKERAEAISSYASAVAEKERLRQINLDEQDKKIAEAEKKVKAEKAAREANSTPASHHRGSSTKPNKAKNGGREHVNQGGAQKQTEAEMELAQLRADRNKAESIQYDDKVRSDVNSWDDKVKNLLKVYIQTATNDEIKAAGITNMGGTQNAALARQRAARTALENMGYDGARLSEMVKNLKWVEEQDAYDAKYEKWAEKADYNPVLASVESVGTNIAGGIIGMADLTMQKLEKVIDGDETPLNMKSKGMQGYAATQGVRMTVSENLANMHDAEFMGQNVASFLYNTGMSMADSGTIMALRMAGIPPTFGTAMLGCSAAVDSTVNAKARGLTDTQALLTGYAAGVAECVFEKVSLDHFLKTTAPRGTVMQQVLGTMKNIGTQGLVEASEEVSTSIANAITDAVINGDLSEYNTSVRNYQAQGYTLTDAQSMARKDFVVQLVTDAAGGFLSGGVFGMFGGDIDSRMQSAKWSTTAKNIMIGMTQSEESEVYKAAKRANALYNGIIDKLDSGAKVSEKERASAEQVFDELGAAVKGMDKAELRKAKVQVRAIQRASKASAKQAEKATKQVSGMMKNGETVELEQTEEAKPAKPAYATELLTQVIENPGATGNVTDKQAGAIIADRASVEALGLEYGGEKTLANMTAAQSRAAVRKAVQEHKARVEAETAAETTEAPAAEQTAQTETVPEQEGFTSYEQFSKEFREDEHFKDYSEEEMQRMYQLTKEWNKRRESKVFLSDIGRVVSLSEFRQFAKQAEKQDGTEYTEEEILGAFDAAVESTKADVERHEADRKANLDTMAQNIKSAFEARKLGIDVEVVYGENEYFQAKGTRENAVVVGNKIVFNGNVINSGEAMLYVLGHELVHPGARVDKELVDTIIKTFQYLADNGIIKGNLAKRVKNLEETIENTRQLYQQHEDELAAKENREAVEQTTDKVREEVAADLMREAFASTEICKEIVGYNPGLANKVKDAIRRVKNAITGADGKLNPEAQQKLDELNQRFDDALKLVAEKNSRFNDDNVEGKVDSGAEPGVPNPSRPQFSLSTWEQPNYKSQFTTKQFKRGLAKEGKNFVYKTGHDVLADLLDKEGVDADVADRVLTWMDGMADFMRKAEVKYQFINLAEVNNAKVSVRYDTSGKPLSIALSAMVKNGEYPVNFDLTQICKRREAMSKFVNKLLDEHQFSEFSLSKANLLEIVKILRDEGYDTACTGCFVESKRYYMEDFTKRFVKKWNDAVKKINPNAEYFNFADANREITREEIEAADEAMEAFRTANAETSADKTESLEEVVSRIHESGLSEEDIEAIRESNRAGHEAVDADLAAGKQAKFNSNKYVADKTLKKYTEPRMVTETELKYLIKRGVFGGKKANNAEQIENLVKSDPVFQRLLTGADIMTTGGLTQFTQLSDTLVSLLSGSYGSGAPKLAQGFIPYNNEIAFLPDKVGKINLSEYLQGIAGLRSQSFSDFKIENVFDYFQMAAELTARHLPAHMYTKELACAKILGMLGVKVNMSVMFNIEGDEYWGSEEEARKYAGLIRDKDGNITYNYADKANSDRVFEETGNRPFIQSIDVAGAFELQDDPRYSKNVGVIGVGYGDEHIRMMLNDPRFRYIIPYHRSSLPVEISNGTNLNRATDYTSTQNTLSFKVLKPDGKGVSMRGKSFKSSAEFLSWVEENGYTLETKKAQAGHGEFDLYGDLEKTNDPKQTAENYKAWCWEHGYLPLFYQFSSEENYYKLLYDFSVYDHEGNYAPQDAVQMWNEDGKMTGFPDDITDVVETEMKAQNSVDEELWNPEKVEHVIDRLYDTVKLDKQYSLTDDVDADTIKAVSLAREMYQNGESIGRIFAETGLIIRNNGDIYQGISGPRVWREHDDTETTQIPAPDRESSSRNARTDARQADAYGSGMGRDAGSDKKGHADVHSANGTRAATDWRSLTSEKKTDLIRLVSSNLTDEGFAITGGMSKIEPFVKMIYDLYLQSPILAEQYAASFSDFAAVEAEMEKIKNSEPEAPDEGASSAPEGSFSLSSIDSEGNRMEATLNTLKAERTDIEEQLDLASVNNLSDADTRKLENRLAKIDADITKIVAEERKAAVRTPMQTILDNLPNYRMTDLHSLAEQVSEGAWDGYEELSRADLEDALREAIEERELSPLEMQAKKFGLYVRPVDNGNRYSLSNAYQNDTFQKHAEDAVNIKYSVEDDELKSFLDAYDEAFGEGASKADFTSLTQQLRAARRARRTAEMAEESKQAKISLSNRGRLATERAWEIYHKHTVRTVRNEYRAKLEQARKDKIAAVKQAVVVERAKAEVKLEEQELAERMNAKKQAAKRLGLKDEQIQQMKNKSKEKSQLQRNASRNTLKNKRLADKKRAAIETEQGPISTIRENPQQRTFVEKLQSAAEDLRVKGRSFYKNFVNKAVHIDLVAKRQTSNMTASTLVTVVGSTGSTVESLYTRGMVDRAGNIIGKSMKEVFLCDDGKGHVDYDKQALLQDYMLHQHNVDRMSLVSNARTKLESFEQANQWLAEMDKNEFARLTAMTEAELKKSGKQQAHDLAMQYSQLLQEYSEATDKPVFPDENGNPVTAETSRQIVAKYEAENAWLVEKAQSIYDWWDQFMKTWVVGDSITQEQYDTMREMYPHYGPTYRVDGKGLSGAVSIGAKGAKPGQVVKSAKGGLGEIVNIEDSFANLAAKAVKSARVNELYKNLVDTAMLDDAGVFEDYMLFDWDSVEQGASYATQTGEVVSVYGNGFDVGESVAAAEAPGLVKTKDGYKVSAWYNGRLLSTYVSEDLFTSLQETTGAVKDKLDKVAKVGSVLTNPMKTAITGINPNFALRNTKRDFPTAIINSTSGLAFPKYWARAWKEIYRSDAWHNFVALGGTNSLYYNTEGGFGKAVGVERGAAGTVKKVWNGTKNVLGFLNETTESVTRFAEYLATIDRMGDTYENRLIGIKNAAEVTVDFSRKGSYGAAINAWVPYWNPAVQGIDKVFRSVFAAPNGKKAFAHGMATLGRAVMTTVLLEAIQQVILAVLGRRDDWEELNDRTKDTYYCIPTKDHKFIKIPKNREWGAILGTPLMRLFEGFTGRDDPFENFLETSIIPNFLPGGPTDIIGISQYIDLATNKDFAGRSIVPYAYTQGSLAGQYDDKTSEMAKLFSKLLGEKLSPMQVDYIIQDYFGDFGDIATMLTAKSTWGEDESVKGILESLWKTVESPWVTDNRYSNADVSVYYENIDELERTWNDKKNHGDGESYKDSIEYKTFQAVVYKSYGKEISEINKQIKDLPDGEKKDELKDQIAKLAGQANEFIDKCLSGDIEAPDLVFEYENLPVQVSDELIRLRSLSDEYSFKPSPSSSKSYVDPTSKVGNKAATREYVLDDEAKAQYNSIYEDTYSKTMQATINSYEYRKASDTHKAEMLEDARDTVAPAVKEEFMLWLQRNRKPTQRKK